MNEFSFVTKNRTEKRGGGVGLYVSDDLSYEVKSDLSKVSNILESIFIEIEIPGKKNIIVGEIYKPPTSNTRDFIESLQLILSAPSLHNRTCIIMGDFNLDLLQCHERPLCQDFLDLMLSKSYAPTITKPTRITESTATLIDNIHFNSTNDVAANSSNFHELPMLGDDPVKGENC